ncbi:ABC transporter ATP-binding protein [Levilactobacillus parabrevis]|uniref:ABC-type cobalamin Fe3+-siderophores transport system, ATPase component n=1 Tax=Levilactobacillus parabrevis ATCC 53295 TaxID=1267003 RepID=A0A0R1GUK3_9LACO|nr:ABC transporter ATP-binding protein [Levilactobacillus parabrevis]KRK37528.1 ABC-type cobalamin Fe3+-siderophores transport system, ATPase component [Levilactobacillus parabrevis ATCC 53295]KRO05313.1 ABC-type cobalamin Fe3+-siderophores transport system, ATPase component [Levilactobacillus parabrevis]
MELQHVSYQYLGQENGVIDLSGTFPAGKITTIIGPNGAGKSTLLKILSRQVTPRTGTVTLAERPLTAYAAKALAQKIAVVSQRHELYDDMTVAAVVKMGRLPYHGLLATVPDEEVADFLAQTALTSLAAAHLDDLSGGQQQRVWLAMALAQEPQVLLLDEPTTYLDVHYQQALMAQLRQLAAAGMTVIQVLHDINQAFTVSDWLWLLQDGRLVATGTPHDLRRAPLLAETFQTPIEIVNVPRLGPYIVQVPEAT